MAEQQDLESDAEQQELAESQLVELRLDEVSDDNQLHPFVSNMSPELLEAIKESKGNTFNFEFHRSTSTQNTTNYSGEVTQGNITNIKDTNIKKVGVGDEIHSEREEQPETLVYQQDIDEGDQIEEGYETYEEQSRDQRGISLGGARRKSKQKSAETQKPLMFDSDAQTDEIQTRTVKIHACTVTFNTEIQTDDIVKRDRCHQTDLKTGFAIGTQANILIDKLYGGHQTTTEKIDKHSQTEMKLFSDNDVQTENLDLLTNETQTEIKSYQDDEIPTEHIQTVHVLTQTSSANIETMPGVYSVITEAFQELSHHGKDEAELKMMKLYNEEGPDLNDLQPLVTLTWKIIQLKIITKSLERHLTDGKKWKSLLANTCLKLISQLDVSNEDELISDYIARGNEVYKLGEKFQKEKKSIHAVVAFYAAAKLHKLENNGDESVLGIMQCVVQIQNVIGNNIHKLRKLVVNHVIPLMHDCVTELSNIKNANPDNVVENKARCLFRIGLCYSCRNEHQQHVEVNVTVINMMSGHFGESANKYQVYGLCLHNAGVGFGRMNKPDEAVEYYKMAVKAYEKAEDWTNDEEKNDEIARAENNLKITQAKLRE